MASLKQRLASAVARRVGVRLSRAEAKRLHRDYETKVLVDAEDWELTRQRAACAVSYLNLVRCGICGKVRNKGYVCLHCEGDDTDKREEEHG